MKRFGYKQLAAAGLALLLLSCTKEQEPATIPPQGVPAVIDVTIADAELPQTRHTVDATTDNWTTRSFSAGDRIGIFATGGLVGEDGESQWILNAFMNYDQATGSSNYRFRNDELLINTGMMGGVVGKYVYFPYSEEMPSPKPGVVTDRDSSQNEYYRGDGQTSPSKMDPEYPGLYLRQRGKDYKNRDIDRCVDYMYISNISLTNGALGGGFYHGFSEMIIMRGEGFDQLEDQDMKDEITVVLNNGYTRLRLNAFRANTTGIFSWRPENYFWPDDANKTTVDGKQFTTEEAKRWKAWKGADYIDTNDGEPWPREAWYVILPTAHSYSYPSVTYIELYNNEGDLCQVSNFDLYVNPDTGIADKQMRPGKRYAVEIMMVEAGATIRPHEILDWNEGEDGENDITDERTVGIGSADDYYKWAIAYNDFVARVNDRSLERPSSPEEVAQSPLSQYGDYDLEKKTWRFYVTDNIQLTTETGVMSINELQDVLEGASQMANFSISNLKTTFIQTISRGGELRNLDFDNLYVKPAGSGYYQGAAGALTSHLNGGTIDNCRVNNGTVIGSSSGTIGMLCGMVSSGTVTNCTVTGALIGTAIDDATYKGLFGGVAAGASLTSENNDASGVIYTN